MGARESNMAPKLALVALAVLATIVISEASFDEDLVVPETDRPHFGLPNLGLDHHSVTHPLIQPCRRDDVDCYMETMKRVEAEGKARMERMKNSLPANLSDAFPLPSLPALPPVGRMHTGIFEKTQNRSMPVNIPGHHKFNPTSTRNKIPDRLRGALKDTRESTTPWDV